MEVLEFTLDLEEQSVVVKRKDGVAKTYTLRELTGRQKGLYLNTMSNRLSVSEDGKVTGIKNFEGLESSLLSKCLFNEENKPVTDAELQEFPARVLRKLFDAAQILSGLNSEGVEKAKND